MSSLKDALDMLNVSMEQSNSLYRNIVKKMFDDRLSGHGRDSVKVGLSQGVRPRLGREEVECGDRDAMGMVAWSSADRARTRSSPSS